VLRILLGLFILFNLALAQDLSISANASSKSDFEAEIVVDNIDLETAKVGFRLASNNAENIELGLRARQTFSWGPVGNIILNASADYSNTGLYDFSASAQGVVADVSAEIAVSYFNDQEGSFNIDDAFSLGSRPMFPELATANFDLSAKYKIERNVILSADYNLYLLNNLFSNRLQSELGFKKVFNKDGLGIETMIFQGKEGLANFALLGVNYELKHRAWPTTKISLRLGTSDGKNSGVYPGLTISMNKSIRSLGAKWGALLWLEPYRTDLSPYRAKLFYEQDILGGKLSTALYSTPFDNLAPLILSLKYKISF